MKSMKQLALGITTTLFATTLFAHGHNELTLQDTKTMNLDAASLTNMKVDVGSGALTMKGSDTDVITVVARIYQEEAHSDYVLTLDNNGNAAQLNAENDSYTLNTRIDLEVSLPKKLAVMIHDGSGSITLDNVKSADINDGSGSISVSNIAGDLTIDDGSGSINVTGIQGSVKIDDGSGSITVNNVVKGVTVNDGSGSINIDNAASFTLLDDGSGSVNVKNVKGQVNMDG